MTIKLWFDGACAPYNPGGVASYGYVLKIGDDTIRGKGVVGEGNGMTNNVAEYSGILHALKDINTRLNTYSSQSKFNGTLEILGDSKLVIAHINKRWGMKNGVWNPHKDFPHLRKILMEVMDELKYWHFSARWIPRHLNEGADELSKLAYEEFVTGGEIEEGTDQQQTCKKCLRKQYFEFIVNDYIWGKVTGNYPFAMCIECFLSMAHDKEIQAKDIGLNSFYIIT